MPQTKHLLISSGAVIAVLLVVAINIDARTRGVSVSLPALITQNEQVAAVEVSVSEDDNRLSARERLVAELKTRAMHDTHSLEENEPASRGDQELPAPDEASVTPRIHTAPARGSLYACLSEFTEYNAGQTRFGNTVSITTAEGARVIASESIPSPESGGYAVPARVIQLPEYPNMSGAPSCLPEGVIGILDSGILVHAGESFEEYVHNERVVGYALDGFPILGGHEEGSVVSNAVLDECHGHTHVLPEGGTSGSQYHYHVTSEFPYTIGCFRGTPTSLIE